MSTEDQTGEAITSERAPWERHSFDELAKGLASGSISRSRALKLLGGAILGGLLVSAPGVALAKQGGIPGPPSQQPPAEPNNPSFAGPPEDAGVCPDASQVGCFTPCENIASGCSCVPTSQGD